MLVEEDKIKEFSNCLISLGYEAFYDLDETKRKDFIKYNGVYNFENKKLGIPIDVHTKTCAPFEAPHLAKEFFFSNTEEIKTNGFSFSGLNKEALLVALSIHGAKHAWTHLKWICDIDVLISEFEKEELKRLLTRLENHKIRVLVLSTLLLSHEVLNTKLPDSILSDARSYKRIRLATKLLKSQMFNLSPWLPELVRGSLNKKPYG